MEKLLQIVPEATNKRECIEAFRKLSQSKNLDKTLKMVNRARIEKRVCHNFTDYLTMEDIGLYADNDIMVYKEGGKNYCFVKNRNTMNALLKKIAYPQNGRPPAPRNPYTRMALSPEFIKYLEKEKDSAPKDTTSLAEAIEELFEKPAEYHISELEKKKQAISRILEVIDVYIDLDRFIASEYKKLPRGVANNEKSIVEYLYNNKNREVLGFPLIYIIVKYDDNLRVIKREEQRLEERPREREIEIERIRAEGREETEEEKARAEAKKKESDESVLARDVNVGYLRGLNQAFGEVSQTASMDQASEWGLTATLQMWKDSGLPLYSTLAMDMASENGHVDVLQWWKNSGLELKYSHRAMDEASRNGRVDALEWWKNSGLELKYENWAIDDASENGRVDVLQWWKNSGLELKYTDRAIDYASAEGHLNVLQWWKDSGLELKYSDWAIETASRNGHLNVLQWWKNSGLEFNYSRRMMEAAARIELLGRPDVVQWMRGLGLLP